MNRAASPSATTAAPAPRPGFGQMAFVACAIIVAATTAELAWVERSVGSAGAIMPSDDPSEAMTACAAALFGAFAQDLLSVVRGLAITVMILVAVGNLVLRLVWRGR